MQRQVYGPWEILSYDSGGVIMLNTDPDNPVLVGTYSWSSFYLLMANEGYDVKDIYP